MPHAMRVVLLLACAACASSTQGASQADLQRARTRKPRDDYRGQNQTLLSRVLNEHLMRQEPRFKACADWSAEELQEFIALVVEHRAPELEEVYQATKDRRRLQRDSVPEFRAHWGHLNQAVSEREHLRKPMVESHCRQAVMYWTHHLGEKKRAELRATPNLAVPLLPEGPKAPCGKSTRDKTELEACVHINEPNSCDWCHSTQAAHDAGVPGASPPSALNKIDGPDDGNPHGWDRKRRCDQDQMPRCQLCEGIGGHAYGDENDEIDLTTCEVVAKPSEVDNSTVHWPLYPKVFTVKRTDGKPGYSDTLIGWKTDPFCFSFFPQNDSHGPLCYRSQDSYVKYYDIGREAMRTDYNIKLTGFWSHFPNITAKIIQVQEEMWITQHLWAVDQCVCANPSGNHCTNPPCKSYVWHWDTFRTAQHLGREKVGVEWLHDSGVGKNAKVMELDHFIMWSHHAWTDPVSGRIVRMWKPFNGLQNYDPTAWTDSVENPEVVFESPPALCKKGGAKIRIKCDDEGHYHPGKSEGLEHLDALHETARRTQRAAPREVDEALQAWAAGVETPRTQEIFL